MEPNQRILSFGAGVQSSALLILSARGDLPKLDAAIFSDTGWEPAAVYAQLDRLEEEVARPAGIPIYRVSQGNIRDDALNPAKRFATMPLHIRNGDGTDGLMRRQCTSEYKLKPLKVKVKELLGATVREDGRMGLPPGGAWAEQWIGISTDEQDRAYDKHGQLKTGLRYSRNRYPLLELGLSRDHCYALLREYGLGDVVKSACIGCPFHNNRHWRQIRETPAEWADAIAFDAAIRKGSARATSQGQELRGEAYLHRARVPLSEAPIDHTNYREWAGLQRDAVAELAVAEYEERLRAEDNAELAGCSPFACRSGDGEDDEQDDDEE